MPPAGLFKQLEMKVWAYFSFLVLQSISCLLNGVYATKQKYKEQHAFSSVQRQAESIRSTDHTPLTQEQRKRLRITYDSNHPVPREELRKIRCGKKRARLSDPNAKREIQVVAPKNQVTGEKYLWKETKETNAEFLLRRMDYDRNRVKARVEVQRQTRLDKEAQTGVHQLTPSAIGEKTRREEAKRGNPNDPMIFTGKLGKKVADPRGRTKSEYLSQLRQQNREAKARGRNKSKAAQDMPRKVILSASNSNGSTRRRPTFDLNKSPPNE